MGEEIVVNDQTYTALVAMKSEDESFDELVRRLISSHNRADDVGAGQWEGSDASERARDAREEMKRDLGDGY